MWIMVGEGRVKAAAVICEYPSLARRKHRGWGRGWKEKLPYEGESLASCCCFVSISQGGNVLGKVSTQCPYKVCNLFLKPWNRPSVQSLSHVRLCDTMDCSTPGLPVHHQLRGFTQTHVHWLSDAIQPSHPLSFPSSAFSLSQYQGLFRWVSSSNQVAKVLEFQLQDQSFQWIFRTDFLWMDWLDLFAVQGTSKVFNTTFQKYQFFCAQLSL